MRCQAESSANGHLAPAAQDRSLQPALPWNCIAAASHHPICTCKGIESQTNECMTRCCILWIKIESTQDYCFNVMVVVCGQMYLAVTSACVVVWAWSKRIMTPITQRYVVLWLTSWSCFSLSSSSSRAPAKNSCNACNGKNLCTTPAPDIQCEGIKLCCICTTALKTASLK